MQRPAQGPFCETPPCCGGSRRWPASLMSEGERRTVPGQGQRFTQGAFDSAVRTFRRLSEGCCGHQWWLCPWIGVAQAASGLIRPISQASWSTLTPNLTSDKPAPGRPDRLRTPAKRGRSRPRRKGRVSRPLWIGAPRGLSISSAQWRTARAAAATVQLDQLREWEAPKLSTVTSFNHLDAMSSHPAGPRTLRPAGTRPSPIPHGVPSWVHLLCSFAGAWQLDLPSWMSDL